LHHCIEAVRDSPSALAAQNLATAAAGLSTAAAALQALV
jgi:hypothetical protein